MKDFLMKHLLKMYEELNLLIVKEATFTISSSPHYIRSISTEPLYLSRKKVKKGYVRDKAINS